MIFVLSFDIVKIFSFFRLFLLWFVCFCFVFSPADGRSEIAMSCCARSELWVITDQNNDSKSCLETTKVTPPWVTGTLCLIKGLRSSEEPLREKSREAPVASKSYLSKFENTRVFFIRNLGVGLAFQFPTIFLIFDFLVTFALNSNNKVCFLYKRFLRFSAFKVGLASYKKDKCKIPVTLE